MATKKTPKAATKTTAEKKPVAKKVAEKSAPKTAEKKKAPKTAAAVFSIHDDKTGKFVPVEDAKPIKISGFADLQFFVHRNSGGRPWCISEASSGGRIAHGNTRADAVRAATETLKKHSREDLLKTIAESIKRTGVAPGFEPPAGVKMETSTSTPAQPAEENQTSAKRGRKPSGQQSQLDIAVTVLREAAEPLTCKEIVRRMLEGGLWQTSGRTPGATLSASMQREISRLGKAARFVRTARGLYGLNG